MRPLADSMQVPDMRSTAAAGLLVVAVVSGCTSTSAGDPQPSSPEQSTSTGIDVPPITGARIDLTAAKNDPCVLISGAAEEQYGLQGPIDKDLAGATGPNCSFGRKTPNDPVVTTGVNTKSGGLAGLYARRSNFAVFTPTQVSGYPALYLQPVAKNGSCSVNAAVNDAELVYVDLQVYDPATAKPGDACSVATSLLETVIASLPK